MSNTSKKKWIIIVLMVLLVIILTSVIIYLALFLQKGRSIEEVDLAPRQITTQIIEDMDLSDLTEVQQDQLIKHYNMPDGVIEDFSIYMSKSANKSFELACFKLQERKDYDQLQQVIAEHITTKAQGFKELSPTEYDQIQSYRLMQKGRYVLMVIGDNASAIEQEFISIFSEES